jgi:hypothetical protein
VKIAKTEYLGTRPDLIFWLAVPNLGRLASDLSPWEDESDFPFLVDTDRQASRLHANDPSKLVRS